MHRNNQSCGCADNVCSKCGLDLKWSWYGRGKNKFKVYEYHKCDMIEAKKAVEQRAMAMLV
jgi:ssDNA-binding Zn-finger/Zn-ribbon topoisomerase 1